MGPLAGIKVLEFSEIIAAPFAGVLLSDMGAEVIKVEPPGGDPWRGFQPLGLREGRGYISLNRGKRGMIVDLNAREGQEIVQKIAARSDVVDRQLPAGRRGEARHRLPDAVARRTRASSTATTPRSVGAGPYAHRPGYDLIAQAVTGLMSVEGREENGVPLVNALPSADLSTGIAIAWGICAALYARERTGRGQRVDTTLMSSALSLQNTRFMSIEATDTETRHAAMEKVQELRANGGTYKQQLDVVHNVRPVIGNLYYRCYKTADGFIAVGCLSTPLRKKLLGAIGMEDWRIGKRPDEIDVTDPEMQARAKALVDQAEAIFAAKPTDAWLRILDHAGVPAGPLKFTEELLDDPQVLENNFVTSVDHPLHGAGADGRAR